MAMIGSVVTPPGSVQAGSVGQIASARAERHAELRTTICNGCRLFIADILMDSFTPERWRIFHTEHETLQYFAVSRSEQPTSLSGSQITRCSLCMLLNEQCALAYKKTTLAEFDYSVFIKLRDAAKYQFYVTSRDLRRVQCSTIELDHLQAKPLRIFSGSIHHQDSRAREINLSRTLLRFDERRLLLPRIFDTSPGSDESFNVICGWLQECLTHHKSCGEILSFLPKRVLDISSVEPNQTVKLYFPPPGTKGCYVTVSYNWGASEHKRLKTMNHSLDHPEWTEASRSVGIEESEFPRTLQDAIHIARRLKFQYLWIDSVCIVQDDANDWAEQSALMTQIYSGSRINICASSSEHSDWGILGPIQLPSTYIGEVVMHTGKENDSNSSNEERQSLHVLKPLNVLDLEEKHLSTRGWVFQERLVSAASLHYTDEGIVWECTHGIKLRHNQAFRREDWKAQWMGLMNQNPILLTGHQDYIASESSKNAALSSWKEWVAAYSERELYDYRDRLPAIAGVAKTLAQRHGLTYAAGLWQEDLIGGLMWKRFNRTKVLRRFDGDTTPSWSWASVQGKLEYVRPKLRSSSMNGPIIETLSRAMVDEERPGSFGKVLRGRMRVVGLLQEVIIDRSIHPGVRQREWEEVGVKSGFVRPDNVLVTLDDPWVTKDVLYHCQCLRLGSFSDAGRTGDIFLLLEQVESDKNHFRRVGLVETDAWSNSLSVTGDSGKFESAEVRDLVLV